MFSDIFVEVWTDGAGQRRLEDREFFRRQRLFDAVRKLDVGGDRKLLLLALFFLP